MMEDNYLWDRSGEPDAEVQELEELLGTLRYIPRPLEIPADIQPVRRRSFFPTMAIAAAIALLAVMAGLWFSFNRGQAPVVTANNNPPVDRPRPAQAPAAPAPSANQTATAQVHPEPKPRMDVKPVEVIARRQPRTPRTVMHEPKLTPEELAEKEQVLVALRLVSFKLNVAQRRTQGTPQINSIRNQHRIG